MAWGIARSAIEHRQLLRIDSGMVGRAVAKPSEKGHRPDAPQQTKDSKGPSPIHKRENQRNQRRRKRAAPAGAEPEYPLSANAFAEGKPNREDLGQIRKTTGLSHAKQKAADHQ